MHTPCTMHTVTHHSHAHTTHVQVHTIRTMYTCTHHTHAQCTQLHTTCTCTHAHATHVQLHTTHTCTHACTTHMHTVTHHSHVHMHKPHTCTQLHTTRTYTYIHHTHAHTHQSHMYTCAHHTHAVTHHSHMYTCTHHTCTMPIVLFWGAVGSRGFWKPLCSSRTLDLCEFLPGVLVHADGRWRGVGPAPWAPQTLQLDCVTWKSRENPKCFMCTFCCPRK